MDYFIVYDDGKLIIEDEYSFEDIDYQREGLRFENFNLYPIQKYGNKRGQFIKLLKEPEREENFKGFIGISNTIYIPIEEIINQINFELNAK